MTLTLDGNGTISGLGDINGHDLETNTIVNISDATFASQAVGRATLFIDASNNTVGINTTTPNAATFLEVADGTDPIVSLNNTSNGEVRLGCTSTGGYIGTESGHPFNLTAQGNTKVRVNTNSSIDFLTNTSSIVTIGPDSGSSFHAHILNSDGDLIVGSQQTSADTILTSQRNINFLTGSTAIFNGQWNSNGNLLISPSSTAGGGAQAAVTIYRSKNLVFNPLDDNGQVVAQTDTCSLLLRNDAANGSSGIGNFAQIMFDTGGTSQSIARIAAVRTAPGSNDLVFTVEEGNTKREAARFKASGDLAFPNGQGIDFSASAGSGATSNTLDDYEEGSWLPSWNGYTTGFSGRYTKIGRTVTLRIIRANSFPAGTITSGAIITGLPFIPIGLGTTATQCQFGGLLSGRSGGSLNSGTAGLEIMPVYLISSNGILLYNQNSVWTTTMLPSDATGDWVIPASWQNGSTAVYINWEFTYQTGD